MYTYRAKVLKVVDGDTVNLEIDLGLETYRRIKCRLWGINAPEMNTVEGKAAKAHLAGLIEAERDPEGWIVVDTFKDRTEKYGRYLVVLAEKDGQSINTMMVEHGHAVKYLEDR